MTEKELKEMLNKYPDDMEIVNERYSDYEVISEDEWSIVKGVYNEHGQWVMRSHSTMSNANKQREKAYLALAGN